MPTINPSPLPSDGDSTQPYDRAKAVKQFDDHRSKSQIPTVDLSAASVNRPAAVDQVRRAASTLGFFQVINHGIPVAVLDRTIASMKAFHEEPTEKKAGVLRRVSYICNMDLFHSKAASWRDKLEFRMGLIAADPKEIPEVCREEVMAWDREVKRLGEVLMGLLSEGLGLSEGRFSREMGMGEGRVVVGNYYPFCPQPDLTVALESHWDPGALTVLLQDHIGGLQVRTSDGWVDVKPVPGALVINIGDLLQIISNEEYKSPVHRALANSSYEPRVSVAVFLNPSEREKTIGPLPELTSTEKPALYRNVTFNEIMTRYFTKELDGQSLTDFFRL